MGKPLLAGDIAEAVLRSEYFVTRNASQVELVESSNRPASSVFQIRVHLDPTPGLFWVKIRPAGSLGSGEGEGEFLERARDAFDGLAELSVPNPVAYLPDFDAVVTEDVEGVSLNRLIKKSLNRLTIRFSDLDKFERHFQRCGGWLAILHSHVHPMGKTFESKILREYVDVRLARLEAIGSLDSVFRERVIRYLDSLLPRIEPEALARVWTHGDFAPYNVVVTPERLVVLDPDIGGYFAKLGNYCSRYEDIVHFHRFTQAMSMSSRMIAASVRKRLSKTFLTSYAAAGGPELSESSAAFRAFRLKYELLEVTGMQWPSVLGRLTSQRLRVRRFRRWFDAACLG